MSSEREDQFRVAAWGLIGHFEDLKRIRRVEYAQVKVTAKNQVENIIHAGLGVESGIQVDLKDILADLTLLKTTNRKSNLDNKPIIPIQ